VPETAAVPVRPRTKSQASRCRPRAKRFYGVIAAATVVGALLDFSSLDSIRALFWSAVINGVVAVPVMAMTMLLNSRRDVMGRFVLRLPLKVVGWAATVVMGVAAAAMFATMGKDG
jgi:Mn2+/Fe2+ NRAMP family transporter